MKVSDILWLYGFYTECRLSTKISRPNVEVSISIISSTRSGPNAQQRSAFVPDISIVAVL